ncbi:hypothetical protein B6U74_06030 [Candidatus Bathyarchaeota archaeon ex4484_205]|nr:MAG: hypothetical protein B6U74_06030 [Candidatus Bathyarchaeota archaeon ex4484_205]
MRAYPEQYLEKRRNRIYIPPSPDEKEVPIIYYVGGEGNTRSSEGIDWKFIILIISLIVFMIFLAFLAYLAVKRS